MAVFDDHVAIFLRRLARRPWMKSHSTKTRIGTFLTSLTDAPISYSFSSRRSWPSFIVHIYFIS